MDYLAGRLEMVTFKLIPGCVNYYAGNDGHIYSNFGKRYKKLVASVQSTGKYYALSVVRGEKRKHYRVHRLVCEAFHGVPESGMTCSHLDGNWQNNTPENLAWESYSDNLNRKKQHGTDDVGCKNTRAKINQEQLLQIRQFLYESKLTHQEIGDIFGVNRVFITKINTGQRYKGQ